MPRLPVERDEHAAGAVAEAERRHQRGPGAPGDRLEAVPHAVGQARPLAPTCRSSTTAPGSVPSSGSVDPDRVSADLARRRSHA